MKYSLAAILGIASLGIGCAPVQIKTDSEHQYMKVESFYGEENPDYIVSVGKDDSRFLMDDMINGLNAISRAKKTSLSSVCRDADYLNGDRVIDFKEYAALMRKMGNFESMTSYPIAQ